MESTKDDLVAKPAQIYGFTFLITQRMKGLKVFCVWVLAITVTVVDGQSSIAYVKTQGQVELRRKEWSANNNNIIVVPFQRSRGNILIEAELSAQKGLFMLDTGSPTLIINNPQPKKEIDVLGVNAAFRVEDTMVKWLKIEQAEWKNILAYALDMRHLEASNRQKLLGLIGFDLLRKHEILIDSRQKLLYLFPTDEVMISEQGEPLAKCELVMAEHLPLIEVEIEGHVWRFGIDTGAESNLISEQCLAQLPPTFYTQKGLNNLRGLDKKIQTRRILALPKVSIGGLAFTQIHFTEMNFEHLATESALRIDGIIGSELLNSLKFSINYRKKNFKIWAQD